MLKSKTLLGLLSVFISISLAYFLSNEYDTLGFIFGIILGRFLLSITYPIIVKNKLTNTVIPKKPVQLIFLILIIWFLGFYFEGFVEVKSWISLIFLIFSACLSTAIIFVFLGLKKQERYRFIKYTKAIYSNRK